MNFIRNETLDKLRGGYYTDPHVAKYLVDWVLRKQPKTILEPSCGDGAFLSSILSSPYSGLDRFVGVEIDPEEARKAREVGKKSTRTKIDIASEDFLSWFLKRVWEPASFDGVVGNPPFIRYQYLPDDIQAKAQQVIEHFGLPFTKHTNAWVPFLIASISVLRPGGRIGMVIPSEILHVLHAQSARDFLRSTCSKVLVVDPEGLLFDEALQGVVLLLAERATQRENPAPKLYISSSGAKDFLQCLPEDLLEAAEPVNLSHYTGKWMPALLTDDERGLLQGIEEDYGVKRFGSLAKVDVGIVTGANKFFLVNDETVIQNDLGKWAHPMFGRSGHVPGVVYDHSTHSQNKKAGLPTNFIWFQDTPLSSMPPKARNYILRGEQQDFHKRYKCRIRTPWYNVPSVSTAPIGMLKRCHDIPRLILNQANAYTTDTAYRISPCPNVNPARFVYSFINSLTCLSAELEGRHYGGGVLELVPSEIERLLVPLAPQKSVSIRTLDKAIRSERSIEHILEEQDAKILEPLGLSVQECTELRNAADRLRRRRHRERAEEQVEVPSE
jgi:adenine-specific DNA-methyltransferase